MVLFIIFSAVIGSVILLDKMAVGEFGISQPIIACPLISLIFNDFYTGLFLGVIIQLVWIGALPLGSKEPPDNQTAGVVAIVSYQLAKRFIAPQLIMDGLNEKIIFTSLILAGIASLIGQSTLIALKKFNNRLFDRIKPDFSDRSIKIATLLGLATSFLRGIVIIVLFQILVLTILPFIKLLPSFSYRELVIIPLIISSAGLMRFVFIQKKYYYSLLGIITGVGLWIIFTL